MFVASPDLLTYLAQFRGDSPETFVTLEELFVHWFNGGKTQSLLAETLPSTAEIDYRVSASIDLHAIEGLHRHSDGSIIVGFLGLVPASDRARRQGARPRAPVSLEGLPMTRYLDETCKIMVVFTGVHRWLGHWNYEPLLAVHH